jgi:hypothetical protein
MINEIKVYKASQFNIEVEKPRHREYVWIKSSFDNRSKVLVPVEKIKHLIKELIDDAV